LLAVCECSVVVVVAGGILRRFENFFNTV